MEPKHDFYYRFPRGGFGLPGRCRVRIYRRKNGAHTVLLTELYSNTGESIASACERIAVDLVAVRGLNPKTTRWIQHDPLDDDQPDLFDGLQFTWGSDGIASEPEWQRLDDERVEALTGETPSVLSRRFDDLGLQKEEGADHGETETKGMA